MPVPAFVTHPYAIVGLVVVGGSVALYELVFKKKSADAPAQLPADPSDAAAAQAAQAATGAPPAPPADTSADTTPPPVQAPGPTPGVMPPAPPAFGPPVVGPMGFSRQHRPRPPALRSPAPGAPPVVVSPAIIGGRPVPTGDITADVVHRLAHHGYKQADMPLYKRFQSLAGLHADGFPGPHTMRALHAAAATKGLPPPRVPIYPFANRGEHGFDGKNAPYLKDWKARV